VIAEALLRGDLEIDGEFEVIVPPRRDGRGESAP